MIGKANATLNMERDQTVSRSRADQGEIAAAWTEGRDHTPEPGQRAARGAERRRLAPLAAEGGRVAGD